MVKMIRQNENGEKTQQQQSSNQHKETKKNNIGYKNWFEGKSRICFSFYGSHCLPRISSKLTSALLLIIFLTANAFPDSLCSANFAFKFSKNPNFDLALAELLLGAIS